jgi:hypothetical protein
MTNIEALVNALTQIANTGGSSNYHRQIASAALRRHRSAPSSPPPADVPTVCETCGKRFSCCEHGDKSCPYHHPKEPPADVQAVVEGQKAVIAKLRRWANHYGSVVEYDLEQAISLLQQLQRHRAENRFTPDEVEALKHGAQSIETCLGISGYGMVVYLPPHIQKHYDQAALLKRMASSNASEEGR